MSSTAFEFSFRTASQCRDLQGHREYFDWFIKQSVNRVRKATVALEHLADGRVEFDATTLGSVRAHMATINMIQRGLMRLRDHFGLVSSKVEDIQDAMAAIAVDVDSANESFTALTALFGSAS